MKAAIRAHYGGPEVVRLTDVEMPRPGPGEVLVRVRAASINTADLDHLRGRPRLARLVTGLRSPRVGRIGLDAAGEVVTVGEEVDRLQPGDRVWTDLFEAGHGAFGEYVCARERAFSPIPAGVTYEDASTVPHSGILALQALEARGRITPGSRVLVNGAGGLVGPWAIQLAKAFGAQVTGVDHADKLDFMREAGADHVIDYTARDFRAEGIRYDLIVDIAATRGVLSFRRSLASGGAYVLVARGLLGFFQAAVLGAAVSARGDRRMGVFMWAPGRSSDLDRLGAMLQSGEIRPFVDRRIALDELVKGLRLVDSGAARGKVVVTME